MSRRTCFLNLLDRYDGTCDISMIGIFAGIGQGVGMGVGVGIGVGIGSHIIFFPTSCAFTLGAGKGTIVDMLSKEENYTHYSVRAYLIDCLQEKGLPVNRDTMTQVWCFCVGMGGISSQLNSMPLARLGDADNLNLHPFLPVFFIFL